MLHNSKKKYGESYFRESIAILHLAAAKPGSVELKQAIAEMHSKYPDMGWGAPFASIEFRPAPAKPPKLPSVEQITKSTSTYEPRSNDKTLEEIWPQDYEAEERDAIRFYS